MIALSRTGKSEDALRALVVEFNADPLKLPKLKEYYQQTFPDKDFTTFFSNEVVNKWDEAPAFSLPNLDEQTVSLAQFAGKWLVVDFWGHWFGPCKSEMPQIITRSEKRRAGKK